MKIADFRVVSIGNAQWGEMDTYRHINHKAYERWGDTQNQILRAAT